MADFQYKANWLFPVEVRMKTLAILILAVLSLSGCTMSAAGSQSISVDPGNYGTGQPVIEPSSSYLHGHYNGEKLDHRDRDYRD